MLLKTRNSPDVRKSTEPVGLSTYKQPLLLSSASMIFFLHVVPFGGREKECLRHISGELSLDVRRYCPVPGFLVVQLPIYGAVRAWQQCGVAEVGARVEYRLSLSLLCVALVVSGFRSLQWHMRSIIDETGV